MPDNKENYELLQLQYSDPDSLMCIGELIELEKQKFVRIYGIDADKEAVGICRKRLKEEGNIYLRQGSIGDLNDLFQDKKFNSITCLDVLEHIKLEECKNALSNIYKLLNDDGNFIFTGPGVFEKVRIFLGRSPTHLHSHSSYGWRKMIERAGFYAVNVETEGFPIFRSDFFRKRIHVLGKCCLIIAKKCSGNTK